MGLLLLVRHGQASFGAADYDVLSDVGAAQGRRLGEHLRDLGSTPGVIVHGGMRRQRETAESMLAGAGWEVPLEVDVGWAEFDHLAVIAAYDAVAGAAEAGLDRREFQRVFERATEQWIAGTGDGYGETYGGFTERVRDALGRVADRAGPGRVAVVVSSGGPVAAATALLTGEPDQPRALASAWQRLNPVMVNASVTRVVVGPTGARLLSFNEHSFLGPALVTYR